MRVAIVGAGLTGLSCALSLSEFFDVIVFEKSEVGGLLSSYCTRNYCVERFYHHCFRGDNELLELARRLGIKIVWRTVRVGYAFDGKVYPLNTPFEILRFPYLSLKDKIKLALFTIRSRRRDFKKEDDRNVLDGIREELGEDLLERFFMPLLKAKFGDHYDRVSYAWLLARVAIRSNRKWNGEELGYVRHGFHRLVRRMAESVNVRRDEVKEIRKFGEKFEVNGERFDAVVYTAPIPTMDEGLRRVAGIGDVRYQSSVCVLLGSERAVTEDIYWTNVPDCVFGAIIEHTHFMPFEDYGEHVIYLASYSTPDGWLFKMDAEDIKRIYMRDLERFGIGREDVNWIEVFKARYSGPIYEVGYLKRITPYRTKLRGFYVAGMTSPPNYPERSMNGSIKAGIEVAEVLKRDYGFS